MSGVKKEMVHLLANYGHVGFTFATSIVIGFAGGVLLDQKVFDGKTAPWFTFIGLAFGIAAGYKTLLDVIRVAQADEKRQAREEQDRHER
ncbi:AtpZ/AtpI family protein [Desulforhopalus vacuolatus]|uniref:AtpZ/AtpI family protein n=1 Tax=Desulforhopalus vacuolatus TaxID=40414 RepID=UPI00196639F3|nr:AtpZ/AtpI family protein [Desulforhopalus vacuolatus]MBM9518401.1 AtpZ/AtpI family protein [Desulforhopalus vacuolatus]